MKQVTNVNGFIGSLAKELQGIDAITAPEWAQFVKTGAHKERPPVDKDWWYTRSAAVLQSVARLGPIGVSKLRTKYGGRKNRGVRPDRHVRASGSIIRNVLQQLEAAKLIKQTQVGSHKGRVITADGKKLLDKVMQ